MIRGASLVAALTCAACLTGPVGKQRSDGGPSPVDAPPRDAAPEHAWPVADVHIVAGAVADLDHDGLDDLVLGSAEGAHGAIYVVLGQAHGFGTSYVASIPTDLPVAAIDVADLDGDGNLDIAANTTIDASNERVSLFFSKGALAWAPAASQDFAFDGGPGFPDSSYKALSSVQIARLAGAPSRAVVVVEGAAQTTKVAFLSSIDPDGFAQAAFTDITFAGAEYPMAAMITPDAGAGPGLVIGSYPGTYTIDDLGASTKGTFLEWVGGTNADRFASCQAADHTRYQIGGGDNWPVDLGGVAYRFSQNDSTVPKGRIVQLRCGALDGTDGVDLAVLHAPAGKNDGTQVGTALTVMPDLSLQGGVIVSETPLPVLLPVGATSAVLVDGDFDHDGTHDLVVVDDGGHVHCYDRVGPSLVACASTK